MNKHISVMLKESIDHLKVNPSGTYIDLTLGRGGHSQEILKKLSTGLLLAFDKDKQAIKESSNRLLKISNNFKLIHSDYKNLKDELNKLGISKVDGILADLGVSSPQLDESQRGFSYSKDAKLDMRMNQEQELDAHFIVNNYGEEQLVKIFRDFADVMLPKKVAKGIITNRPIESTLQLSKIIKDSLPAAIVRKKNPSKSVFQAIRIEVNNELDSLKNMLKDAIDILNINGTLVVITFHSIEDRIVKRFFKQFIENNTGKLPVLVDKKWKVKQMRPSKTEIEVNKRSRSAKLRVLTKIKE